MPRNEARYKASGAYDERLEGFAFGEPGSFKPYRAWDDKENCICHSGDASKKILKHFEWAVDELLGKGTYSKYGLHKLGKVYDWMVLSFRGNDTPGGLVNVLDMAATEGDPAYTALHQEPRSH